MKPSILLCGAILLVPLVANAQVLVDDRWEDLDKAKTGDLDADWWSSSSAGGNSVEIGTENAEGDMGLVTGTSGRGLHGTFPPQVLGIGDAVVVTGTFTTPSTVGVDRLSLMHI